MNSTLRILGTGASAASSRHCPSCQVFNIGSKYYMVDCGETASFRLTQIGINPIKISKIFITHIHADHFLGLPGMIYTLQLRGAKRLEVYGPKGMKQALMPLLTLYGNALKMELDIIELADGVSELVCKDDRLTVYSLPLEHSVPCIGYKFLQTDGCLEVPDEVILKHKLSQAQIERLESGLSSAKLEPSEVCRRHKPFSYAYMCDTRYLPELVPLIKGCSVLYHETTFLRSDRQRAEHTLHSTTEQAASIARDSDVGTLLIGHYSCRYIYKGHIKKFLSQTKPIFPYTLAASEMMKLDMRKGRRICFSFPSMIEEMLLN